MNWILFVVLTVSSSIHATTLEFETQNLCLQAQNKLEDSDYVGQAECLRQNERTFGTQSIVPRVPDSKPDNSK